MFFLFINFTSLAMVIQTTTPYHLLLNPNKDTLRNEFLGKLVDTVRTPALVIDRDVFAQNCAQMHRRALEWGASFRAHLKTHKVCILPFMNPTDLYRNSDLDIGRNEATARL